MRFVLAIAVVGCVVGCASNGEYISGEREGWINTGNIWGPKGLFWCRAWKADNSEEPVPICYRAAMVDPPRPGRGVAPFTEKRGARP